MYQQNPLDIAVSTIKYRSFYTLSRLSFSKEMSRGECWKCHFRAFRFKYFLLEDAHRPPYKLAPSAPAFKAPHLKYAPPSLYNSLLYGLPAKSLSKLQRLQSAAANLVAGTSRLSHITALLYSSASQHLYHKSKACTLIGLLTIFHLPICARQRKASSVNSLSGEV